MVSSHSLLAPLLFPNPAGHRPVAIVTGSSQGLGLAIALRLADDGCDVVINDLPSKLSAIEDVVRRIVSRGARAVAVAADVSHEGEVKKLVEITVEKLGKLDIMVANAGVVVMKSLLQTSANDFDWLMSVNTRGVMLCFKYAAQQMIKQGGGGKIIGACSMAGKRGLPNICAYSMSKFAVRGLVQSLAQELRGHDICVNGYAPGTIQTDLAIEAEKVAGDKTIQEMIGLPANTPRGKPEDIASLVSYLARPESKFLTGGLPFFTSGLVSQVWDVEVSSGSELERIYRYISSCRTDNHDGWRCDL
ncbi:NAD(P)-binding protein [Thelephora ganbajun]|uniref:NAD(P)-binding protein n=1 Tax=Thelephora ganbajun TaxID=370292 RepID=A0ACB6Z5F7_THEGA|nr:NAD(P)-binding protein [Thelephora ganbajun]